MIIFFGITSNWCWGEDIFIPSVNIKILDVSDNPICDVEVKRVVTRPRWNLGSINIFRWLQERPIGPYSETILNEMFVTSAKGESNFSSSTISRSFWAEDDNTYMVVWINRYRKCPNSNYYYRLFDQDEIWDQDGNPCKLELRGSDTLLNKKHIQLNCNLTFSKEELQKRDEIQREDICSLRLND